MLTLSPPLAAPPRPRSLAMALAGASAAAQPADMRQGVFISGGAVSGPVIGVNNGTINVYTLAADAAGTRVASGPQLSLTVLDTVRVAPRPLRTFLDREEPLAAISAELRPGGGAWLTGAPGCGMSALLRQAASQPAPDLPAGAVYLDGAEEPDDPDELLRRLFCFFHSGGGAPIAVTPQEARAFLAGRRALFVLDRLPLAHDALTRLADALSGGCALVSAEGLAPETLADVPVPGLPPDDARRLLASAARLDTSQPDLADALGRICAALGGAPLAIHLTAQLLKAQVAPPDRLAEVLMEQAAQPGEAALTLAARMALEALDQDQRAVLAALSHTPSLALDALAAISQRTAEVAQKALTRLTELGLAAAGNERYQVASQSLRAALAILLPEDGEKRRAAAFFAAGALAVPGPGLAWLAQEQANLLRAVETLLESGQPDQAGALAQAIQPQPALSGQWSVWDRLTQLVERAADATDDKSLRAWAQHERGTRMALEGDLPGAAKSLEAARVLREALGDRAGLDATLQNMRFFDLLPPPPPPSDPTPAPGPRLPPWAAAPIAALLVAGAALVAWPRGGPPATQPPTPAAATAPAVIVAATVTPSAAPTREPSATPTREPSATPTREPSATPTPRRSATPTRTPSATSTTVPLALRPASITTRPNTRQTIDVRQQAGGAALDLTTLQVLQPPGQGDVELDAQAGTLAYTSRPGVAGADSFTYRVCDAAGACADGEVALNIEPLPLTARDITVSIEAPRGPPPVARLPPILFTDAYEWDTATFRIVEAPAHGSLLMDAGRSIVYTPREFGDALVHSMVYSMDELCTPAAPCGAAPVTGQFEVTLVFPGPSSGDATSIDLRAAVEDPDGALEPGSVLIDRSRTAGAVTLEPGETTVRYVPPADASEADSFGYQVCDRLARCVAGRVTIEIAPPTSRFAYYGRVRLSDPSCGDRDTVYTAVHSMSEEASALTLSYRFVGSTTDASLVGPWRELPLPPFAGGGLTPPPGIAGFMSLDGAQLLEEAEQDIGDWSGRFEYRYGYQPADEPGAVVETPVQRGEIPLPCLS